MCPSICICSFQTFDLDLISEQPCTSWVLMSVTQLIHSPIYRLNQSLLLHMLPSSTTSFTCNVEHFDSGESTNLTRTIVCAVASAAMADRAAVVIKSLCYHILAAECWTYASLAMMKSISIKSAVAKLSFHIHDGCLRQAEVLNKVVWNVFNRFCIIFRPQTLS